ncbi:MAG: TonB-dependent receptor plug domain-containing protein [Gemmatimonadota bacterium]|nr:TonB-dependent receptor plug domain-containing protein [Gemmatimonadota bacterium]
MLARPIRFVLPALAVVATACASARSGSGHTSSTTASIAPLSPTARVIDGERIARSGVQNALDAVRTLVPRARLSPMATATMPWLNSRATGRGTPHVLVDGHLIGDVESLRMIPAHEVLAIHVLSAADATIRFGPQYDGGAIVVQTRASLRRL